MVGATSEPPGMRPVCDECGGHRWSWDGRCLSPACTPLEYYQQRFEKKRERAARKSGRDEKLWELFRQGW